MITNAEWNRIRRYVDQVCNREGDDIIFEGGRVNRDPGGLNIRLSCLQMDLEPEPADAPSGVGWPD